jgi:histidine ammonia-lyase
MGTNAAIKLIEINDNLEGIVAIEYLLASQAIEFIREPISDICRKLHGTIRESVPELLEDRPPSVDIGKIVGLMRTGILRKDAGRFFQN